MSHEDCNQAILRIFPKIDLSTIKNIFDVIPEYSGNVKIISKEQKELYFKKYL